MENNLNENLKLAIGKRYYFDYKENTKTHEITIQIDDFEKLSKNRESTILTPMNYKTHPEAIYTSRLLNYSSLSKPKNDENDETLKRI
ncbi:hypothetical protein Glove_79g109 [Diversispora epigaea]|uniref:Uncharacterized protein n=1 Tax=Diversispora epigaea TaxID=1348612 RepID=A0A397J9A2_9GLOM|nr:hypothetical protein Glove_79g109 [Diversispora epigaea]